MFLTILTSIVFTYRPSVNWTPLFRRRGSVDKFRIRMVDVSEISPSFDRNEGRDTENRLASIGCSGRGCSSSSSWPTNHSSNAEAWTSSSSGSLASICTFRSKGVTIEEFNVSCVTDDCDEDDDGNTDGIDTTFAVCSSISETPRITLFNRSINSSGNASNSSSDVVKTFNTAFLIWFLTDASFCRNFSAFSYKTRLSGRYRLNVCSNVRYRSARSRLPSRVASASDNSLDDRWTFAIGPLVVGASMYETS